MSTLAETPQTTATEDEQIVANRPNVTLFMARRRELRLVRVPRYPIHAPTGQKIGESTGEIVKFTDGRLDVPHEGTMTLEDGRPADAEEILAWLEKHPRNGDVNEGFWRVDPTAPAPSTAELQALMIAATELDADKLERLVRQEEEGWARDAVLTVARGALERVRAIHAQAAQAASEAEAEREAAERARIEADQREADRIAKEAADRLEAEQAIEAARAQPDPPAEPHADPPAAPGVDGSTEAPQA